MSGKPALQILLPYLGGIIVTRYVTCPLWPVIILYLILIFTALLLWRKSSNRSFGLVVFLAMACMGILRTEAPQQWAAADDIRHLAEYEQDVGIEGVIRTPVSHRSTKQTFHLSCDSVWVEEKGYACRGDMRVIVFDRSTQLRQGDRIIVRGRIRRPSGARNPGAFDFRAYLAAQNVHTQITITLPQQLLWLGRDQDDFISRAVIRPAREHIDALICVALQNQERALMRGLLLGLRDEIDEEMRAEFAVVGVVHVLAVSGLHVGFILMTMHMLLQCLRLRQNIRLPLLLVMLWFYCRLTGAAPPVMRASIMAAVALVAPFIQRRQNAVNTIALAAFIILLMQPLDLFTAGFQLSFSAVVGIVLLYSQMEAFVSDKLQRWRERDYHGRRAVLQLLMVSLSAQIVTAPLVAYYFNRLPLYALAANLMVVPLVTLIVGLGMVAAICGFVYAPMAIIYLNSAWLLLRGLILLVDRASHLPYASIAIATPTPMQTVIYFLLIFSIAYWRQPKIAKRVLLALLSMAVFYAWHQAFMKRPLLHITFFDVNQGDAALCEFPDGRTLLIDCGSADAYGDYGKWVILPYLQRHGIGRLNALLLTHGHSDHIGGASSLLQQIKVDRIIRSACMTDVGLYHAIDSLTALRAIPIKYVAAGDTIAGFANSTLYILAPRKNVGEQLDENNCSIVISLHFGCRSILFTGDAGGDWESLLNRYQSFLRADVVKVPHHGSREGQTPRLAQHCACRYAVISVGRYNLFGLPSAMAMSWWQKAGAQVLRTDLDGAIVITTDGDRLWIHKTIIRS